MNRLNLLKRVLASIEMQSVKPTEVIIVDGGSTDGTVEYVKSLETNVIYLKQDKRYISNARNCGIQASKGDIIAFLDDDAIPSSNWLEETIKTFNFCDKIGGVGGLLIQQGKLRVSDRLLRLIEGKTYADFPIVLSRISKNVFEVNRLPGCCMSFRKDILKKVAHNKGLLVFDEFYDKATLCEDADLCFRIRKIGYKLFLNTNINVVHLAHPMHVSEKNPSYATTDKLLSMHENITYFHLKCRRHQLSEINMLQILFSGIYRSLLAFFRSLRHSSSRRMHLNDSYAAILGLKKGFLKYRYSNITPIEPFNHLEIRLRGEKFD